MFAEMVDQIRMQGEIGPVVITRRLTTSQQFPQAKRIPSRKPSGDKL